MSNWKTPMRLVEYLDKKGRINKHGIDRLIHGVAPVSYTHLTLPTNREV